MKYEYMLHTWGGFYNKEHREKHGFIPGYYWFDSESERQKYISILEYAEIFYNARHLAMSKEEGAHTRYRTVANVVFVHNGSEYPIEYDFEFAYPAESAEYMFTDGNYGCDCNRSQFIGRQHEFHELECGETIEMKSFEVAQVLDMDYRPSADG